MAGQSAGRLLVVDDEEPIVDVLAHWFGRKGYEVRKALSSAEARAALDAEPFDLVTLDIAMPEVDGLRTLAWVRAHHPDVGVIMVTGINDIESVLQAMRLGAIDYVVKPFHMELITAQAERGMERQRLVAQNRAYQAQLEARVEERTQQLQAAYQELAAAHAQLRQQVRELEARDRLVRFQLRIHSLEEAGEEVLAVLCEVLELRWAVLLSPPRPDSANLVVLARRGTDLPPAAAAAGPGTPLPVADPLPCAALAAGQPQREDSTAALPVQYRGQVMAVLWCAWPPAAAGGEGSMARLVDAAALVLRGATLCEQLEMGDAADEALADLGPPASGW